MRQNRTIDCREKQKENSNLSSKPHTVKPYQCGLNRRAFLRQTGAMTLLVGLMANKPLAMAKTNDESLNVRTDFDAQAEALIRQVQMHLFPDDNNGPSAADLNAYEYLLWALTDPENIEEGDQEFILQGVSWLEELSKSRFGERFIKLNDEEQHTLMEQIARSRAGENWLSMLLYYVLEALTLDPVYGGNVDEAGWKWLEHKPGYPQPVPGKTYRDFLSVSS